MKKQTKNKTFAYLTSFLNQPYPLIVTIIITLTLSPLYTKTAHELLCCFYKKPVPITNAAQRAANEKLLEAAYIGDRELAREAIAEQADINARGTQDWTALIHASNEGHAAIVHLLLEHLADINLQNKDGDTALIKAITSKHTEIAHLLLKHNANPNVRGVYGNTALIFAALDCRRIETVHLLLKHNADINIQAKCGHTALLWTCIDNNPLAAETLILHGADVSIKNKMGETVLTFHNPELERVIIHSIKKRQALESEFHQQNWDLEASSPASILEQFTMPVIASLICAYADPYHPEPAVLHAIKHYIRNNSIRAGRPQSTPAYTLCCAQAPDCDCSEKIKKRNACAIQ